jgi:hypothetical protein
LHVKNIIKEISEFVLAAVERRRPDDRQAYLDQAYASDDEMRRQVELLLKAHEEAGSVPGAQTDESGPGGTAALRGQVSRPQSASSPSARACTRCFLSWRKASRLAMRYA